MTTAQNNSATSICMLELCVMDETLPLGATLVIPTATSAAVAARKEQRLAVTNRTHGHQVKLSTAVLNQQYPNLSAGGSDGRTVRPPDGYRPQA
ncbi:hypothetical protein quinque_015438 [Culex quinquefasciatus]